MFVLYIIAVLADHAALFITQPASYSYKSASKL